MIITLRVCGQIFMSFMVLRIKATCFFLSGLGAFIVRMSLAALFIFVAGQAVEVFTGGCAGVRFGPLMPVVARLSNHIRCGNWWLKLFYGSFRVLNGGSSFYVLRAS